MRKKVGIIKRVFCISLVFLLSINSFAAIVSDNDGAAFITKAEFDALKNDFQSQIDNYNTSIDNKIDGAIASYLAGIKLATKQEGQFFTPVDASNPRVIKCVNNSNLQKNGHYYNGGMIVGVGIMGYTPDYGSQYGPWELPYWGENSTGGSASSNYLWRDGKGEAWVLGQTGDDVVEHYYKDAYLQISGFLAVSGYEYGNISLYSCHQFPNSYSGYLAKLYEPYTGLTAKYIWSAQYYSGANSVYGTVQSPKDTTLEANFKNFAFEGTYYASAGTQRPSSGSPCSFYNSAGKYDGGGCLTFLKYENNEDKTVYVMNSCNAKVYVYRNSDIQCETFEDDAAIDTAGADRGKKLQNWWSWGGERKMLARWRLALNTWKVGLFCSTPRVRIKQHTGISNSYNNLNQLRNGLIPYDGHYPHYYDGLPLFKSPVDGTAEFKLKMNVTSSTSYSKLRIWIKEGEFENEATPCATCKSECPIIQDINKNTEIAITMPVEKNKYYFMKWTDLNGSTEVGYGGQITQLNELVFINEN